MTVIEMPDALSINQVIRDIRKNAEVAPPSAVRFLVDSYYQVQRYRIACEGQQRADNKEGLGLNPAVRYVQVGLCDLEHEIQRLLDAYSSNAVIGRWAKSICGIGPVISAGFMAHIDIEKAPTVGHIWRFAGLDPTMEWGKSQKRPWNAKLKVLCWKAGESFVKVSGNDSDIYGKVYQTRKVLEIERNERGEFAGQAAAALLAKRYRDDTKAKACYEDGKLPPGHIHARAKRYAVKLFLSHWHEVAYRDRYGVAPPLPYPIAHLDHAHNIEAPLLS